MPDWLRFLNTRCDAISGTVSILVNWKFAFPKLGGTGLPSRVASSGLGSKVST